MKTRNSYLIALVLGTAVCIAILLTACNKEPDKSADKSEPIKTAESTKTNIPSEKAAAVLDDEVVVTVNGVNIYESQIEEKLEPQLAKMAGQMPAAILEQYKPRLKQQILDSMIMEHLLDEKVKEVGIVVTPADVNNAILDMAARENLSLDDMKALIEATTGKTFEQWKQQWIQQPQVEKGLAYKKLIQPQWEGKINITEEDALKYYSENISEFETPEQIRASHILIMPDTSDPNTDPNQAKEAAKAKAEELLQQIKDGADFSELAKANSADGGSAAEGGDLGYFGRHEMVPAFEDAAFALKTGEVSDIVETPFGYHIIKATGHRDPNTAKFDEVKEELTKILTENRKKELAEEYLESIKADANIVYPATKEPKASTSTEPAS